MKILLVGKDGQVGWELQRALMPLGELVSLGRQDVDLTDLDALRNRVRLHRPTFIVNAAAYTAVDKAEIETEKARLVNELAVRVLAEEALQFDCWFIHYSTDYVFDGKKTTAYVETDEAFPLSVYGRTKLDGENAIRNSGCKHLIFRSSWVYSIHGANFPLAILRRAIERDQIDVVSDSVGAPTSASLIADITAQTIYRLTWDSLLKNSASGTYHLVALGKTSWYEYAKFLVGVAKKKGLPVKVATNKIFPLSSESYTTAAKRPQNSQLNTKKLCDQFGLVLPEWEVHVERFINELAMPKLL
jgi:dTDP-4-dehydrorhamnose reductase